MADEDTGQAAGATIGRGAATLLFPEGGPLSGILGGAIGGAVGRLTGGLFGGGSDRNINIPALKIPKNVKGLGIKGGGIFSDSFRDFGPQIVGQAQSISAAIAPIEREMIRLGLGDSDALSQLKKARHAMANANSPGDAFAKNQRAVSLLSRVLVGVENFKIEQAQIKQEREQFLKDNPDFRIESPPDEPVTDFDRLSKIFLEEETARTSLIDAQQEFEALQADDTILPEAKADAERIFNLKIADFLSATLAKGASFDFSSIQPEGAPVSSSGIFAALTQRPQQQAQTEAITGPEPFKARQPLIQEREEPIKRITPKPVGFPTRGAGLLSLAA